MVDQVEALDGDCRTCERQSNSQVFEDDIDVSNESRAHLLRRQIVLCCVRCVRAVVQSRQGGHKVPLGIVVLAEKLTDQLRRSVGRHLQQKRFNLIRSSYALYYPS